MRTTDRRVLLGEALWRDMSDPFRTTMALNGMLKPEDRMQVWGAFLTTQVGSMAADLGRDRAATVVRMVQEALHKVRTEGEAAPNVSSIHGGGS